MTYQSWRSNWGPLAFVWGMWLLFSYYLVVFVRTFGVDCPHYDEWENVPALTGEQPLTWKWLWHQHNEHRIVVPRLVYLGLTRVSHGDFRTGFGESARMVWPESRPVVLAILVATLWVLVYVALFRSAERARACLLYTSDAADE